MTERILQGRELTSTVKDLKAHVQWKIDSLPELAKNFSLGPDAITGLESHLRSELDYLSGLPEGVTLREVMESHFSRGAQTRKMVTGKED